MGAEVKGWPREGTLAEALLRMESEPPPPKPYPQVPRNPWEPKDENLRRYLEDRAWRQRTGYIRRES